MSLLSKYQRKPYDYRTKQEIFDALPKHSQEDNPKLSETDPVPFNKFWMSSKSLYGGWVAKLITPVLPVPEDKSDQCVNMPNYMDETIKEMMKDDQVVRAAEKGKIAFTLFEYENEHGVQIGCRLVELGLFGNAKS